MVRVDTNFSTPGFASFLRTLISLKLITHDLQNTRSDILKLELRPSYARIVSHLWPHHKKYKIYKQGTRETCAARMWCHVWLCRRISQPDADFCHRCSLKSNFWLIVLHTAPRYVRTRRKGHTWLFSIRTSISIACTSGNEKYFALLPFIIRFYIFKADLL